MLSHMRIKRICPLLLLVLAGCTITPTPHPTASPPVSPSPVASATPGPEADLHVEAVTALPGETEDEWDIVGVLVNKGSNNLGELALTVAVRSEEGALLGERSFPLINVQLEPGDSTVFHTHFTSTLPPTTVTVSSRASASQAEEQPGATIEESPVELLQTEEGTTLAVVYLTNRSGVSQYLEDVIFLVRDSNDDIEAATWSCYGPHVLPPDNPVPCVAELDDVQDGSVVDVYTTVLQVDSYPSPPIELLMDPSLSFDPQGRPLLTGTIRNSGSTPYWTVFTILAEKDDMPYAMARVILPAPIPPGEIRPYTIVNWLPLVQGATITPDNAPTVDFTPLIDPRASSSAEHYPRPLIVSITSFEPIGSNLFIRGSLTNAWPAPLVNPSVLGAVRNTRGDLLVSAWETAGSSIPVNGIQTFQLVIPLPEGVDYAMSEYDIAAYGVLPE